MIDTIIRTDAPADPETRENLRSMAHMLRVIEYMIALDKASGYEDFDAHGWQERAHREGITEVDMVAYRESEARIALGRPLPF